VAAVLPERQPMLRLGFGVDQIGNGFGLREVQTAIFDGTARELPRLGRTEPVHAAERLQQGANNGTAAMDSEIPLRPLQYNCLSRKEEY
jgi:hypothetical protein